MAARTQGQRAAGVFEFERQDGQEFVVDLLLSVDLADAATSDDLHDTVDYGALAAETLAIVQGPPFALVEAVAEQIAQLCLGRRRVAAVEVTVHKPQAPVDVVFDDIAVTVRRARTDR